MELNYTFSASSNYITFAIISGTHINFIKLEPLELGSSRVEACFPIYSLEYSIPHLDPLITAY